MSQVEVFRTNVPTKQSSRKIAACLGSFYEGAQISFDLEDVDRVLRIAGSFEVDAELVAGIVNSFGFEAEVLPDEIVHSLTR